MRKIHTYVKTCSFHIHPRIDHFVPTNWYGITHIITNNILQWIVLQVFLFCLLKSRDFLFALKDVQRKEWERKRERDWEREREWERESLFWRPPLNFSNGAHFRVVLFSPPPPSICLFPLYFFRLESKERERTRQFPNAISFDFSSSPSLIFETSIVFGGFWS